MHPAKIVQENVPVCKSWSFSARMAKQKQGVLMVLENEAVFDVGYPDILMLRELGYEVRNNQKKFRLKLTELNETHSKLSRPAYVKYECDSCKAVNFLSTRKYWASNKSTGNSRTLCEACTLPHNYSTFPKFSPGYRAYKRGAIERDLSFDLTQIEFNDLTNKPCFFCKKTEVKSYDKLMSCGIDRKDPTKGYSLSNCLPCCKKCNGMKMSLQFDDFISQIKDIAMNMVLL